jgi:hypothetical protein
LPRDQEYRRRGGIGRAQAGSGVESAGAGGHQGDAGLAGHLGVAIGHIGRGLLVARVDQAQRVLPLIENIEHRHDLHAGQTEDRVHALGHQLRNERLGSCHLRHVFLHPNGMPSLSQGNRPRNWGNSRLRSLLWVWRNTLTSAREKFLLSRSTAVVTAAKTDVAGSGNAATGRIRSFDFRLAHYAASLPLFCSPPRC